MLLTSHSPELTRLTVPETERAPEKNAPPTIPPPNGRSAASPPNSARSAPERCSTSSSPKRLRRRPDQCGSEFKSVFELECEARGLELFVLPPKRPDLNGGKFYAAYDLPCRIDRAPDLCRRFRSQSPRHGAHDALGGQAPAERRPQIRIIYAELVYQLAWRIKIIYDIFKRLSNFLNLDAWAIGRRSV